MRTPPIGFTEANFCAVLQGIKTETRRLSSSDKPKYNVGDICYLTEPTQIDEFRDQDSVDVQYFWHKSESLSKAVSKHDLNKIMERKSGCYSKQIARFMLKSFARYHIKITDVRLERLLDITKESAIAEGIETKNSLYLDYMTGEYIADPIQSYLSEIAAIHPPTKDKIGGWDLVKSNPWVWVYKFRLIK